MNTSLRNRIAGALGGGAIAIITVMLSGNGGLEGREYVAYKDVIGVITVCDGHTGKDIIPGKRWYSAYFGSSPVITSDERQKITVD